jgi:predicted phosphodiesterase
LTENLAIKIFLKSPIELLKFSVTTRRSGFHFMFRKRTNFKHPYKLQNGHATVYEIPPSFTTGKIGLIIADHHLDRFSTGVQDADLLLAELSTLLSHLKPDYILMLGDTLEWNSQDPALVYDHLFEGLSKFQLPIFLISGNHDRSFLNEYDKEYPLITIIRDDLAISIRTSGSNGRWNRIVFAHDFGNEFHVTSEYKRAFMRWMRNVFNSLFDSDDLLFFGHTHKNIVDEEYRCYSMAPFAPSLKMYDWGIVCEDHGFNIVMMTGQNYEELVGIALELGKSVPKQ